MRARRGRVLLLAIGAIAVVALLPGTATAAEKRAKAQPSFEVQKRSLRLELSLKASNGYSATISTVGHKRVSLTLVRGEAVVAVTTKGKVNRHGIEAEFGDMGEVSVRFEGTRAVWGKRTFARGPIPSLFPPECKGTKPVLEEGMFRGSIRFRDENDFAHVAAQSAPGTVARHYRRVCKVDPRAARFNKMAEGMFNELPVTLLRAATHAEGATVRFQASAIDFSTFLGPDSVLGSFTASSTEHHDGMRIVRTFSASADEDSFSFSGKKAKQPTATVLPPKPFAGEAKFLKQDTPATWTGPLTVRLPGAGLIELTGPEFETRLCHLQAKALFEGGCEPGGDWTAPPSSPFSQSHSSGQRLPVPGLLRSKALLVEVAAELR